ncbi:MAG: universal stress protein [Desulfatibacillaceae bacterium]
MQNFQRILFPVDLSDVSPKMVPFVKSISDKFGSEIHLLFVVRVLEHFTAMYVPDISIGKLESEMVQGAERKMEEFVEKHFTEGRVKKASVVMGDPAEEIVEYVNENAIDMVVMGTHGRKGIEKVFFGSVAEKVVKMSPAPVMTINPWRERAPRE